MEREKVVALRMILLLVVAVMLIAGCSQKKNEETGTLQGTVTVGPLCPVEPCNLAPGALAKALETRRVVVYTQDQSSTVIVVDLKSDGSYKTDLLPGTYLIDIHKIGMDSSGDVPKEITIETGKTIELNIDVDTGMR
ncbi:MAG: hypothetical protein ABIF01_04990 [Candidatus Micrarchaeota archaeon]